MDDRDRAVECMQMLQIIKNSAESISEYLCSSDGKHIKSYNLNTTVIDGVSLDSFDFVISQTMSLLEHGILHGGNMYR